MSSNKADFDRRNEEEDEVELRKTLATSSNTAKETQPEGGAYYSSSSPGIWINNRPQLLRFCATALPR